MRAYIRPGESLADREKICRLYTDITTAHLERSWTSAPEVMLRRVTSTSILLKVVDRGNHIYWLFTRNKEV